MTYNPKKGEVWYRARSGNFVKVIIIDCDYCADIVTFYITYHEESMRCKFSFSTTIFLEQFKLATKLQKLLDGIDEK